MLLPWRTSSRNRTKTNCFRLNRPRLELLEDRLVPTMFTVLNTSDSGANSLRDAITQANADSSPGTDVITFNIAQVACKPSA